jgi:hypothetical protein
MRYFTIHRILASSNLLILLVLVTDNFVITPKRTLEIYNYRSSVETRGSASPISSHYSYFINTKSGDQFQLPVDGEQKNLGLNEGDTFFVDISRILRRPVRILCSTQAGVLSIRTGIINNGFSGKIMIAYILLVSLIHILPWQIIKRNNLNERLIFSGSAILLVLLFFNFYQ